MLIPHWILVGALTNPQDARAAEALGADAVSVSIDPADPRCVRLDRAAEIAASVTIETVLEIGELDGAQLREAVLTVEPSMLTLRGGFSEDEPPPLPWFRSFRCADRSVLSQLKEHPGDRFLVQVAPELMPGEPGWQRDRTLLSEVGRVGAMVLAGVPRNELLGPVVEKVRPWGLRLRSCIEREPGWMDRALLEQAMLTLRGRRR